MSDPKLCVSLQLITLFGRNILFRSAVVDRLTRLVKASAKGHVPQFTLVVYLVIFKRIYKNMLHMPYLPDICRNIA